MLIKTIRYHLKQERGVYGIAWYENCDPLSFPTPTPIYMYSTLYCAYLLVGIQTTVGKLPEFYWQYGTGSGSCNPHCTPLGSCVLKYQRILSIHTLDQHLDQHTNQYYANSLLTLDQHSVDSQPSVDKLLWKDGKLVDSWPTVNRDVDRARVVIECQLRCWRSFIVRITDIDGHIEYINFAKEYGSKKGHQHPTWRPRSVTVT